ncbi:MAG: hypothetical protein IPP19_03110 [Verrucomicrobia bacterium]|nr:hypothetical protein [Verrucomicrobiota bacterium]
MLPLSLLLYHGKITMAVLATITILLLTVLVAVDSAGPRDQDDATSE